MAGAYVDDLEKDNNYSGVRALYDKCCVILSLSSDLEDLGDKWEEIKRKMKEEFDITDVSYKCFIEMLGYRVKDNYFYIMVPAELNHALNYLSNKYKNYFRVSINEVLHKDYEILFRLELDDGIGISDKNA